MASSCCSASASLDLTFLQPHTASNKIRFSVSRRNSVGKLSRLNWGSVRGRVMAVRSEEVILVEKEGGEVDVGGNGSYGYVNGKSLNGSVGGDIENESLVTYVNGNGISNGNGGIGVKIGAGDVEKKDEKKKSVEEIGQEEAWFKRIGKGKVEVSVAPGGRWNRFKTYSTIQRTCEIWGFVLSFLFKAWFNNQKFAYRG